MTRLTMELTSESWALKKPFTISGRTIASADVIVVTLSDGHHSGRGECWPFQRYGHTTQSVMKELSAYREIIEDLSREDLQKRVSKGPARNAVDCAMWDLQAKRAGTSVWKLAGLDAPAELITTVTIGLGTPEEMAKTAAAYSGWPIFKLKLGAPGDLERVHAVRQAAPNARLSVDVNEGWTIQQLEQFAEPMSKMGVELLEQPLPAFDDEALRGFQSPIPLAADESCHDVRTLEKVIGKYQMINIKLDKTGGLTEALKLAAAARDEGLGLMVGCMMGTSLAMAPGFVVASQCAFVDLDAPLANAADREHAMRYADGHLDRFTPELWG